jgi:hypothetical protein
MPDLAKTALKQSELIDALDTLGVLFLRGGSGIPKTLAPDALMAALATSPEARLRVALIRCCWHTQSLLKMQLRHCKFCHRMPPSYCVVTTQQLIGFRPSIAPESRLFVVISLRYPIYLVRSWDC